jgi:hypothetical protein
VANAGWDIMADTASYMVSLPAAGGTANALTVTNGRSFGSLVTGLLQILNPTTSNTGPATFAPDGLAAEAIFTNGAALASGEIQPGLPAFLKYDGTQWNLLNPAPTGKNFLVDPCCRVAQGTAVTLSTSYAYGLVDLVQCKATGTAVSAGTLTQDTAYSVAAAATAYSSKIAGATITGTGKVFFRRWIESRDASAFKGQHGIFSVLVRQDTGSALNAFLTINSFQTQDSPGTVTQIATGSGSPVSVASGTDTPVTLDVPNMSANSGVPGNGFEIILEMDCGAVTTKDFWATDWQACIKTLAQKVQVPDFNTDFVRTQRYFEMSYEYGTAPGTSSTQGSSAQFLTGRTTGNAAEIYEIGIRFLVKKLIVPAAVLYSPANGATGDFNNPTSANVAVTASPTKVSIVVNNNTGGSITSGTILIGHWVADARL